MPKHRYKYLFLITSALLLLQLGFLLFIKYTNQELSASDFSLLKTGNIFNVLIYLGLITGLYIASNRSKSELSFKTFFSFTLLTWILLIASFISTRIEIFSDTDYILSQSADKVLTGVLFFLFLFVLIFFLLHVWTSILSKKNNSFIRTSYSTVLIFILFFILIILYIDNIGYASGKWVINKNQRNVAIVLGAAVWTGNIPSPTLSSRVDRAIELLKKGFAGKIVLTGGKAPGELSEAEVGYEYAKINSVDTAKVFIETYTSSTTDQMKWIKTNLSLSKDSVNDIIVVSDRYHLPRVIEISKFFNLNIKVAESFHKLDFKDNIYNKIREGIALFNFWNFAL